MPDARNRQRNYRRRRAAGRLVLRVECHDVDTPWKLVALGFLRPGLEDDRAAVAEAVARLLTTIKVRQRDA